MKNADDHATQGHQAASPRRRARGILELQESTGMSRILSALLIMGDQLNSEFSYFPFLVNGEVIAVSV